jgi:hypothetical protein
MDMTTVESLLLCIGTVLLCNAAVDRQFQRWPFSRRWPVLSTDPLLAELCQQFVQFELELILRVEPAGILPRTPDVVSENRATSTKVGFC